MGTSADSVETVARGAFPALAAKVGVVEATINLATVSAELVADGEGVLDDGDIIQCLSLAQGTVVLAAGIEIMTTVVGATALPVGLGITGGDVDAFVTEVDIGSSTSYVATDHLPQNQAVGPVVIGDGAAGATTDTIDILIGTQTGDVTAGVLRVWAVIADMADMSG